MKIAESIISSVALLKKTRKHRQSQLVEARALTTVSRMVRRVFVSVNGRFKVGRTTNPFFVMQIGKWENRENTANLFYNN